jgi:ribosomal protein S19
MGRAKWKGGYISKNIFKKSLDKNKIKKVWSRDSTIPNFLLNNNVLIHTGKQFRLVLITKEKIGFKFGEFCFTRKRGNKFTQQKKN